MPDRCHTCWNFVQYCDCEVTFRIVDELRTENFHPSTANNPLFMQISELLDPQVVEMILQLMGGGLADDRDSWIKSQTENLDSELRDLLS